MGTGQQILVRAEAEAALVVFGVLAGLAGLAVLQLHLGAALACKDPASLEAEDFLEPVEAGLKAVVAGIKEPAVKAVVEVLHLQAEGPTAEDHMVP